MNDVPDGNGLDGGDAADAEGLFRALFDGLPVMVLAVDARGKVCGVNRLGAAELGCAPERLVGEDLTEIFHPDDRDVVREHLAVCLAEPEARRTGELRMLHSNGETFWVREMATAPPQPHGSRVVLVVCESIPGGSRADEELRQRLEEEVADRVADLERVSGSLLRLQRQQQALLDGIPDIAWIKDADSRYLAANASLASAFGFEPAALVGKSDSVSRPGNWPSGTARTIAT